MSQQDRLTAVFQRIALEFKSVRSSAGSSSGSSANTSVVEDPSDPGTYITISPGIDQVVTSGSAKELLITKAQYAALTTKAPNVRYVITDWSDATAIPLTNGTVPSISGTSSTGGVLTVSTGVWSATPDKYQYQWLRGGVAIAGATSATYTVLSSDGGATLSANVTAIKSGYTSPTVTSASITLPAAGTVAQTATLVPTANGTYVTGWNYEGSIDYTRVASNDGGTTALYSPTTGDIVTYQATDLPSAATSVASVTIHTSVFKLDPGTAITHGVLLIGGVVYESTDQTPVANTAYEDLSYTWTTNPATGAAWTVAAVNAMEIGIKKTNNAGERVSYIAAVVSYM